MQAKHLLVRAGDLLWPRECLGCPAALECDDSELCPPCWTAILNTVGGSNCHSCGDDRGPYGLTGGRCGACRTKQPGKVRFARIVLVGNYQGPLRNLILRFKREARLESFLGSMLGDAIAARLNPDSIDYWVPIPSHWRRKLARGFQPTELLAVRALRRWGLGPAPILRMTRNVPEFHKQLGMTASQRAKAIRGAFRVVNGTDLQGRSVCLVDDITTTGATLKEARRVLRLAGVRRVFAAVLAKSTFGQQAR